MPTTPRLTYRYDRYVELVFQNKPGVMAYRVGAADALDTAFAGTTSMFTVGQGATFQSPSIRRRRVGRSVYTNRGLTVVHYDPEDYWVGGGTLPHDAMGGYLRVEEQNAAGVFQPEGPILIVPPPGFFVNTRPNLTVSGTAPNVAVTATGVPPAGALHFVLPRFADSTTITNGGAASIFVSFNAGLPEVEILTGQSTLLADGAVSEVFVRGDGAVVPFSMFFAVVNAEMA
jgi:hypothetical protein